MVMVILPTFTEKVDTNALCVNFPGDMHMPPKPCGSVTPKPSQQANWLGSGVIVLVAVDNHLEMLDWYPWNVVDQECVKFALWQDMAQEKAANQWAHREEYKIKLFQSAHCRHALNVWLLNPVNLTTLGQGCEFYKACIFQRRENLQHPDVQKWHLWNHIAV